MPKLEEQKLGSNIYKMVAYTLTGAPEDQLFGVNVAKVREIIWSNVEINKLPKSKPSIIGTFRLRDQIHPLIDLSVTLDFADRTSPPNPETDRVIIVAEFNERMMGFLVRNVERIFSFSADEIEKPPIGDEKMDYIVFYAMLDAGRYLSVLDFERIGGELGIIAQAALDASIDFKSCDPKVILLAEDSSFIRKRLSKLLKETGGHTVIEAEDGRHAWDKLETIAAKAAAEGKPIEDYVQLISSDVEMPRLDGMALLVMAKKDPRFRHLPFIFVSTLSTEEQKKRCLNGGASDYLVKLESEHLLSAVATHAL